MTLDNGAIHIGGYGFPEMKFPVVQSWLGNLEDRPRAICDINGTIETRLVGALRISTKLETVRFAVQQSRGS